jgi:serralysin
MGHSFGLKHGHDGTFHGTLAPQVNDNEFSVMTYASYFGANTATGASEARLGSSPTSYMMYDIAALQVMYGANFDKVGIRATYRWDKGTGQQFIGSERRSQHRRHRDRQDLLDGVDAGRHRHLRPQGIHPGPGRRPAARPLPEILNDQLADLNNAVDAGTAGYIAQGNVYNALLYHGDLRSAVANLITGIGNDT